ncbi:MAG: efflux RND transporter periplasmic adaptor subunit [Paracoccaceae bacterium]
MNMPHTYDLEMANTLNAIVIDDPSEDNTKQATKRTRWPKIAALTLVVGGAAAYVLRDDLPEQIAAPFVSLHAMISGKNAQQSPTLVAPAPGADAITASRPPTTPTPTIVPAAAAVELTGSGYVIAPQFATLYAPRPDEIVSVFVSAGDTVDAGTPMVAFLGRDEQFAYDKAKIAHARAVLQVEAQKIALEQSQQNLAQTERLETRGIVTRKQHEEEQIAQRVVENTLAQAQQTLAQTELDLRIAEYAIERLVLRAPFSGTVTDLRATVGITTQEGGALEGIENSLMTFVNTANLIIEADFAERNIAIFENDVIVEAVLDAYPDQPFEIQLERVAAVASAQKGTISARFRPVDAPEDMRPNMAVRIRVTERAERK